MAGLVTTALRRTATSIWLLAPAITLRMESCEVPSPACRNHCRRPAAHCNAMSWHGQLQGGAVLWQCNESRS